MDLRPLVAAAAVALLTPAAGLVIHGLAGSDRGAQARARESAEEAGGWVDKAAKHNEALDGQTRAIVSELASSLREADPRAKQGAELKTLEDLLSKWDAEKETSVAKDVRRTAAFAFRNAIRLHFRRPARAERHAEADAQAAEAMKSWAENATRTSQEFEKQMNSEESDFGEAVPKGEEEKDMERLKDLIDSIDPKNASEIADLAAALAQAVRRRPRRKAARSSSQEQADAESKVVEAMKVWVEEANKASQDMEKEARSEESDLGEAVPKGQEEKDMERLKELIDDVDPKNASEMADLAAALGQVRRTPKRQAARHSSQDESGAGSKVVEAIKSWEEGASRASRDFLELQEAINAWVDSKRNETTPGSANEDRTKVEEAVRNWVAQSDKATSDLDREIDAAISDLSEEVPKGDEERDLERMQGLIDSVDPTNASEVADLAASLARSSSFTRRVGQPPVVRLANDWTEADSKNFWNWLGKAEKESKKLDQEFEANEKEFVDYVANMTAPQAKAVHAELKTLEELWERYGFENESLTAEDMVETELDRGT